MTEQLNLGRGNKLIYVIDLDDPDAQYEKNKLAKMDEMVNFIWDIQNNLVFNRNDDMVTAQDVFDKLLDMLRERNLVADELTF